MGYEDDKSPDVDFKMRFVCSIGTFDWREFPLTCRAYDEAVDKLFDMYKIKYESVYMNSNRKIYVSWDIDNDTVKELENELMHIEHEFISQVR